MLSDRTIRRLMKAEKLKIWSEAAPLEDIQFQSASVELRLANDFIHRSNVGDIPFNEWTGAAVTVPPGMCLIASTWETVELPDDLIAIVDGKSTWGRKFLLVHATAGYIDPGFAGEVTLEIKNIGEQEVVIRPGDRICQLRFFWTDHPVLRPYGHPELKSHYMGQQGPTLPHGEVLQ